MIRPVVLTESEKYECRHRIKKELENIGMLVSPNRYIKAMYIMLLTQLISVEDSGIESDYSGGMYITDINKLNLFSVSTELSDFISEMMDVRGHIASAYFTPTISKRVDAIWNNKLIRDVGDKLGVHIAHYIGTGKSGDNSFVDATTLMSGD